METKRLLDPKKINGSDDDDSDYNEIDHIDIIAKHDKKTDFTSHLALAIAACTLGSSFQFGYNSGIINAPEDILKAFYNETYYKRTKAPMPSNVQTVLWALTVSIFCAGGMVGGTSAGYWANRFGRKGALLRNNVVMVVGVVLEIVSHYIKSYELLIAGRFVVGLGAGVNTGIAPIYLSEIAPVSLRGLCGTFNQLAITFGVMMSEIIGLQSLLGTRDYWQFALGFSLVPVVFQLCTLTFCPESPQYLLIAKHEEEQAESALIWLRKSVDVGDEIEEMISEREAQRHIRKFSVKDLFKTPSLRKPLVICIVMHLSQQLSGINAVIFYSTSIFEGAGLSESGAQYATLATGAVNVSMTFVSALIMDRLGRRTLHLTGLGGLFIFSYILAVGLIFQSDITWFSYICVGAVICYIVSFATGPGSIPWFFTAELFSQGPRSAAVSVGVLVNWSANFSVGLLYPILQKTLKAYSFIPFVVFLAVFWMYTLLRVPETKGKTIEEITALFREKNEIQNNGNYSRFSNKDT